MAEVWRVAFRQVVRIGESAKVGKCQNAMERFGKTKGVSTCFNHFSGDFLDFFLRFLEIFLERLILYRQGQPALSAPLDLKIFWRATSFTRGSGACGVTVSLRAGVTETVSHQIAEKGSCCPGREDVI